MLQFLEKLQEKLFLKLSVQVVGLKNKDKSAKMKVQKNHQKIPYNILLNCYMLLLEMH